MGQFSVLNKKKYRRKRREFSKQSWPLSWYYYKDLYGTNNMLLLLNEYGDPSFLVQN